MDSENIEMRFGTISVEKGFVTADQVIEAMNIQILEDIEKQEHRLIGSILLDQGLLTLSQIDEVLKDMLNPNPDKPEKNA